MNTQPTKIDFVQSHQPGLESGEYQITIDQDLTVHHVEASLTAIPPLVKEFYVAGERFHLQPTHIDSVFPPAHSLGNHANVFPHIMLSRNTLPWEREAIIGDIQTPWLALLVVHQSEQNQVAESIVTLKDLKDPSNGSPMFPGFKINDKQYDFEPGQTDTTKVTVLDVEQALLSKIMPTPEALNFLTHVRQTKDDAGNLIGHDTATIVANRLPQPGAQNKVYLVSLENRLAADGTFDDQGATDNDKVRLVTLHSWEFTSTEHFKVSASHLERVSELPNAIKSKLQTLIGEDFYTPNAFIDALTQKAQLTTAELNAYLSEILRDFAFGDFAQVLKHLDRTVTTMRLPHKGDNVEKYLKNGFYPLPHHMRQGAQTVSWYHGPLSPRSNSETFSFPAQGSDALLRYYKEDGMFDVSYAAAWELGRLLALQNTHFSTSLYQWKRNYAKASHHQSQQAIDDTSHLSAAQTLQSPSLPASVQDWLTKLEHLEGVPFNYLVPDEELLPTESIRFFQLDRLWMESLLDGAFSIGRVTSSDHVLDTEIRAIEDAFLPSDSIISGFIMRSEAVAGWPGMEIEGYKVQPVDDVVNQSDKISLIRRVQLSENVLLCLFDGDLQTLDLHLKPEVLHFGINIVEGEEGALYYEKVLRDDAGVEHNTNTIDVPVDEILVLSDMDQLLTNIRAKQNDIAWPSAINEESSAQLALQMLEGVERVRFVVT